VDAYAALELRDESATLCRGLFAWRKLGDWWRRPIRHFEMPIRRIALSSATLLPRANVGLLMSWVMPFDSIGLIIWARVILIPRAYRDSRRRIADTGFEDVSMVEFHALILGASCLMLRLLPDAFRWAASFVPFHCALLTLSISLMSLVDFWRRRRISSLWCIWLHFFNTIVSDAIICDFGALWLLLGHLYWLYFIYR